MQSLIFYPFGDAFAQEQFLVSNALKSSPYVYVFKRRISRSAKGGLTSRRPLLQLAAQDIHTRWAALLFYLEEVYSYTPQVYYHRSEY